MPQGGRAEGAARRPGPDPHDADPAGGRELCHSQLGEAFAEIDGRLSPILAADRNAVATYLGNPNAHLVANGLYGPALLRALGTHNRYSASTVDQLPKHTSSALILGTGTTVPGAGCPPNRPTC